MLTGVPIAPGVPGESISVTCYSGYRRNEKPVKFIYRDQEFEVKQILNSSVEEALPERTRFYRYRVVCESGKEFSLFYNPQEEKWTIS